MVHACASLQAMFNKWWGKPFFSSLCGYNSTKNVRREMPWILIDSLSYLCKDRLSCSENAPWTLNFEENYLWFHHRVSSSLPRRFSSLPHDFTVVHLPSFRLGLGGWWNTTHLVPISTRQPQAQCCSHSKGLLFALNSVCSLQVHAVANNKGNP